MTPRASSSGESEAMAAYAPLSLNAPIGWSDSALRNRRSPGAPKARSGVLIVIPRSRSAAARIASSVTSGGAASVVIVASSVAGGQPLAVDAAGGPRQGPEAFRGDRLAASDAHSERAVVEPGERLVDQHQLLVGTIPQGEVALLREDLAGGRGLRAVRHLARGDDGLADLLEQAGALGLEGGTDGVKIGRFHRPMVCQPYTPWEYTPEET